MSALKMESARSARQPTKKTAKKQVTKGGAGRTGTKKSPSSKPAGRGALFLIDLAALRSRTRRRRLVIVSLILLVGAFFGAALVQAQLVQTQAEADRITIEINRLENDLALLDREVVEASSPEVIVERARRLGMVRAVRPVYLVATRPVGP